MSAPRRPSLAILIAVAGLGTFTLNAILPSMPGLQRAFGTSYAVVQLTLTVYLVGLALAQLAYGPLSDRFGRRPVRGGATATDAAASSVSILAQGHFGSKAG